jgi:hypothetical protein
MQYAMDDSIPDLLNAISSYSTNNELRLLKSGETIKMNMALWYNYDKLDEENLQMVINSIEKLSYHKVNSKMAYAVFNRDGTLHLKLFYQDYGKRFDINVISSLKKH